MVLANRENFYALRDAVRVSEIFREDEKLSGSFKIEALYLYQNELHLVLTTKKSRIGEIEVAKHLKIEMTGGMELFSRDVASCTGNEIMLSEGILIPTKFMEYDGREYRIARYGSLLRKKRELFRELGIEEQTLLNPKNMYRVLNVRGAYDSNEQKYGVIVDLSVIPEKKQKFGENSTLYIMFPMEYKPEYLRVYYFFKNLEKKEISPSETIPTIIETAQVSELLKIFAVDYEPALSKNELYVLDEVREGTSEVKLYYHNLRDHLAFRRENDSIRNPLCPEDSADVLTKVLACKKTLSVRTLTDGSDEELYGRRTEEIKKYFERLVEDYSDPNSVRVFRVLDDVYNNGLNYMQVPGNSSVPSTPEIESGRINYGGKIEELLRKTNLTGDPVDIHLGYIR